MKTKKTVRLIYAFLLVALILIPVNSSFAQDQNDNQRIKYLLNVTPAVVSFELEKGKTQTFDLSVENFLERPMGIRTSLEPFIYPDQTGDHLKQSPILDWIKVSTPEFIIDPQSKKNIEVTISVPNNAPVGGQYAVLFLTPFYSQDANLDVPTVLSKVGVLLIGSYGKTDFEELRKNVQIPEFSFPLITDQKEIETNIRIHNSYHNHFTGKPFIKSTQLLGKEDEFSFEEKNVLPQTERLWQEKFTIEPTFPLAIYSTKLTLSIGEGYQIERNSYFLYFSGSSYLKYIILVLPLIFAFVFRRRLIKAFKTLLTKS